VWYTVSSKILTSSSQAVVDDLSVTAIEFADPYEFPTLSLSVHVHVSVTLIDPRRNVPPYVKLVLKLVLPPIVSAVVVESVNVIAGD